MIQDLKEHYIDFHKVDRDNQFFINLLKRHKEQRFSSEEKFEV